MGIKNTTGSFTYRHPDWTSEDHWTLRTGMTTDDRDRISGLVSRTILGEIDNRAMREALKKGDAEVKALIAAAVTKEDKMSARKATLLVMSKSWGGPEFAAPDEYYDHATDSVIPHPDAGGQLTLNELNIGLWDPEQLDDLMTVMSAIWAGRSPEEFAQFQGGGLRLVGSNGGQHGAEEVPGPANGTDAVPAPETRPGRKGAKPTA